MDHQVLERFGERVKLFRIKRGYSQTYLARITGLNRSHLSAIECGQQNVCLKTIYSLSLALNVPIIDFFTDMINEVKD